MSDFKDLVKKNLVQNPSIITAAVAADPSIVSGGTDILDSGITANRPASPALAQMFFDTTLGKIIVHNGTAWVNADGTALS